MEEERLRKVNGPRRERCSKLGKGMAGWGLGERCR